MCIEDAIRDVIRYHSSFYLIAYIRMLIEELEELGIDLKLIFEEE